MDFIKIDASHPVYSEVMALYERAFPYIERRDLSEQARIMEFKEYVLEAIIQGEEPLGFISYWRSEEFIYLEHIAIMESARGRALGTAALKYLCKTGLPVILEIEPVVDEVTKKRLHFYSKNGFVMNTHEHIQPKYHRGDGDLRLLIMSSEREISAEEYRRFYEFLKEKVAPRL